MRRIMATLALVFTVSSAPAWADPHITWRWELGGVYRTADGYGAEIMKRLPSLGGDAVMIVRVIETPPPNGQELRYKHSSEFAVRDWDSLNEWRPAFLCFTGPRQYVSADGTVLTTEADRYTSFAPCPVVPIQ